MKNIKYIIRAIVLVFLLLLGLQINRIHVSAVEVALIGVAGYSIEGDIITPGTETSIELELQNLSATTVADNVFLSISSSSSKIFPAYGKSNQLYIGRIGKNETKSVIIPIGVSDDLKEKEVDFTCTISYVSEDQIITNPVVLTLPVMSNSNAYLELESFSLDGDVLVPGKDTTLMLKLHNASETTTVKNVILAITNPIGVVYPAYGTDNQYYIGDMRSNESVAFEVPLSVSNSLNSSVAELICEFAYEDGRGQRTNKMSIVLPSNGGTPVVAKTLEITPTAIINSKTLLSVTLWNNSSEDITDARLLIQGPVSEDSKSISLDTLSALQNYSQDCQISFTELGNQSVSIVLQYTDLNGQIRESDLGSYTVMVEANDSDNFSNSSDRRLKLLGLSLMVTSLFIVLLISIYYIKKR